MVLSSFSCSVKLVSCIWLLTLAQPLPGSTYFFEAKAFASSQQLPPYPKMTNAAADDMAGTYAYYMVQLFTVQELSKRFPELSSELNMAQAYFDRSFKASINTIDAILNKENTRWASDKPMLLESLRNKITNNNVAVSQAKAFVEEIHSRARGKIPFPYLETLLIYHPDFLRQPAEEFIRGYQQSFNAKGHPKSKGASFTFKFPSSWMAKEGERPNIVQTFVSEGGKGLEMALISTKSIPLNLPFTQSDIVEMLSPAGLKEMVPKDAKVLNSKSTKIEGEPAGIIEYVTRLERAGAEIDMHGLALTFFQGRTMIQIQFQVAAIPSQNDELTRRFGAFRPIFNLMMNNIVFVDKWKKP